MIKGLKILAMASILSIGSSQAFADSNLDTGKLSECGSFKNAFNSISGSIPDAGGLTNTIKSIINNKAAQAGCNFATAYGSADWWVDYYRLKVNTNARHFHLRIKPVAGPTIKVDKSW